MCGAHAQVMSAAHLSIGLRLPAVTRSDVESALWDRKTIIKVHGPRGTVHLLPTGDLPMWTGAMSAMPYRSGLSRANRLDEAQTDDVVAAIAEALVERDLTMEELSDEVIRRTPPWAADPVTPDFGGFAPRWRQGLSVAANRGVVCFGPNRGRKVTYSSPTRWDSDFRPASREAALKWLVATYLTAYGPATMTDFAKWIGATTGWAADVFRGLGSEIEETDHGYVVTGDTLWPDAGEETVRLLPYFDPYAVGARPRELAFPGIAGQRALAGGQAGTFPVLLLNGVISGIWHQRRAGRKLSLVVEPFVDLSESARKQLDEQVERVASIMEGVAEMVIGRVLVQPHR
jgi:hypothetical protein